MCVIQRFCVWQKIEEKKVSDEDEKESDVPFENEYRQNYQKDQIENNSVLTPNLSTWS